MGRRKAKTYYMAVENDDLELPICISDKTSDLADELGISRSNVFYKINHPASDGNIKIVKVKF